MRTSLSGWANGLADWFLACRKMTTLMIAVAAMTVGAAVGFLSARLICGTASSVQRRPRGPAAPMARPAVMGGVGPLATPFGVPAAPRAPLPGPMGPFGRRY